jgi:4-amino-4-deoxy-L-arabinose transferase-like glycosyltransferase
MASCAEMMKLLNAQSWRRMGFWLVPALALLALLPALDHRVANREQELRVLLTARNMAEGGSWVMPEYRGELRFRKPPLMYWITAVSYKIAGSTDSLCAARLPSALAGLLLLAAIYFGGQTLVGRRRALLASLVCLSSMIFLRQARVAETDIPLALCTAASVLAGYLALTRPRPLRWWLLGGLASGLGFLIKGPAAVAIPVITVLWFAATKPRKLHRVFSFPTLAAVAVCAAIALPWYIAILGNQAASAQVSRELNATFMDSHHDGPWFYYTYTLLHAMAPWSLLAPVAFLAVLRYVKTHDRLRFVTVWFITGFVCLSAISSKQIHYTTLLLAPASLLVGWLLGFADGRHRGWRRVAPWVYERALILLMLATSAALPLALRWSLDPPLLQAFVFAFIAGAFALWAWSVQSVLPRTYLLVASICIWTLFAVAWGLPQRAKHAAVADIATEARRHLKPDARVFAVGRADAVVEFYVHHPIRRADSLHEAWRQAVPGDLVVVAAKPESALALEAPPVPALAVRQRTDMVCALYEMPGRAP